MNTELLNPNVPIQKPPETESVGKASPLRLRPAPDDPMTSVRVPVLPANRDYLRALRAAEMAAWEKACGRYAQARTDSAVLRRPRLVPDGQRALETAAFIALGLSSAFVILYSLWIGAKWMAS